MFLVNTFMGFLRSLFAARSRKPAATFTASFCPEKPFIAIGDVHGCHDRLLALLQTIDAKYPEIQIVCVGDYVDRGEESANVLRLLMKLSHERGDRFRCIFGNHEKMLMSFLDDPETQGARWLRYGGLQTLASFHVRHSSQSALLATRDALAEAMGPDLIAWLRALPLTWTSGNVAVVHAAADPRIPMPQQTERVLLWGHPEFDSTPRSDNIWVVHGHTIVEHPKIENGRISLDTGAYATHRLTAAHISAEGVNFEIA